MAVARQNTRRPPAARPDNYCESKQTYFSCSLDEAFHLPEFQAKLSGRFLLRQPLKAGLGGFFVIKSNTKANSFS